MSTPPPPPSAATKAVLDKLIKYRYYLATGLAITAIVLTLIFLAPRFFEVLYYFLPLMLSTALFVATIVLFSKTSAPLGEGANGLKAGEQLLDYVAGENDPLLENLKQEAL